MKVEVASEYFPNIQLAWWRVFELGGAVWLQVQDFPRPGAAAAPYIKGYRQCGAHLGAGRMFAGRAPGRRA